MCGVGKLEPVYEWTFLEHDLYIPSLLSSINITGLNTTEKALPLPQSDPLPARTTESIPPSISERGNGSSETTYHPGDPQARSSQ